jgi:hypothetical protein
VVKAKILAVLLILAIFSGCGGEKAPESTSPPESTLAPTTTPPPVTTTAPPVTTPPPTPAPGAFFADPGTESSTLLPPGVDKVKDLTDQDYFSLKLPTKTAGYDSGIKGIYEVPTGTVYIMKFKSVQDADFFFEAILQKLPTQNEKAAPKTLTYGGNSLEIYHKYKYNEFRGTYIKKGIFIYFLAFNINEFGVEDFILKNMPNIFLDIGEVEEGTTQVVTKELDLYSRATNAEDVLPEGGSVAPVTSSVYQYDLNFPPSPSYDSAVVGSYTTPAGKIYVFKYRSPTDASAFLQELKGKISRSSNHMTKDEILDKDGLRLQVSYKQTLGGVYTATIIQKGFFLIYMEIGGNEFEAESYIKQNMPYLFE